MFLWCKRANLESKMLGGCWVAVKKIQLLTFSLSAIKDCSNSLSCSCRKDRHCCKTYKHVKKKISDLNIMRNKWSTQTLVHIGLKRYRSILSYHCAVCSVICVATKVNKVNHHRWSWLLRVNHHTFRVGSCFRCTLWLAQRRWWFLCG